MSHEATDQTHGGDINAVAMHALSRLIRRAQGTVDVSVADASRRLYAAAKTADRTVFMQEATALIAAGVSEPDIANIHIPNAARALGQDWVDGTMTFTTVSAGCAILQGYLRQTGLRWADEAAMLATPVGTVLLAVPPYEQHTIGATLLAGQLRAQAVDVVLAYHADADDITRLAITEKVDAVLISSSRSPTMDALANTIGTLKNAGAAMPVILGGSVLDQDQDVLGKTGADFAVQTWQEVVQLLTATTITHAAPTAKTAAK